MYKVLIVDDEVLARVGIAALIPWEDKGFTLVGEAENGEKALVLARKLLPDIIITDIKMPVMDGIELIKTMKEEKFETRFLVLSSYNDFKYVKDAMKHGADEYILKLQLEPESLLKALYSIADKLEEVRKEKEKIQIIEKYYDVGVPLVKEKFLKDLIFNDSLTEEDIENQKSFLNIELPKKNLLCLVVHVEKAEIHNQYSDEKLYLLNDSIIKLLNGVVAKYGKGYAINTEPLEFAIIYSLKEIYDERAVHEHISQLAKNIRQSLSTYMNMSVYIGASNIYRGYKNIKKAYREAVTSANIAFSHPKKSVIRFGSIDEPSSDIDYKSLLDELAAMELEMDTGDAEKVNQAIENIKRHIERSKGLSKEYLKRICSVIFFIVSSFAYKNNIQLDCVLTYEENLHSQIDKFTTVSHYIDWINELQADIIEVLRNDSEQKTVIIKAKRYMQEHFAENISLKTVADYLSMSPGYLSILFKKETGQNFIDYLIQLRMDRAKELLRTTELKIYEVAKMVGYDNVYYFSRIFSKVVGISPKRFQSNSKNVQKK